MRRGLARLLLALLLGATAPIAAQTADAGSFVVWMRDSLREVLAKTAATASIETVRCLYGVSHPDTLYLTDAATPVIRTADSVTAGYAPCPGYALALWHNHLPGWFPTITPGGGSYRRGAPPALACYLSQQDILAANRFLAPPLWFVQVDEQVLCWWSREQISKLAFSPTGWALYLPPLPEQSTVPPPAVSP